MLSKLKGLSEEFSSERSLPLNPTPLGGLKPLSRTHRHKKMHVRGAAAAQTQRWFWARVSTLQGLGVVHEDFPGSISTSGSEYIFLGDKLYINLVTC